MSCISGVSPTVGVLNSAYRLLWSDQFDSHDDEAEDQGESVEEHKSVIMHLLSQVRLGMDLTKVRALCVCLSFLSLSLSLLLTVSLPFPLFSLLRWSCPHLSWRGGLCWRCMLTSLHIRICLSGTSLQILSNSFQK